MTQEMLCFEYETPELTVFSSTALAGVVVGDSECTDSFQELDGFDF